MPVPVAQLRSGGVNHPRRYQAGSLNDFIYTDSGACNCLHGTPVIDKNGNCTCESDIDTGGGVTVIAPQRPPKTINLPTPRTPVISNKPISTTSNNTAAENMDNLLDNAADKIKDNPLIALGVVAGLAGLAYMMFSDGGFESREIVSTTRY